MLKYTLLILFSIVISCKTNDTHPNNKENKDNKEASQKGDITAEKLVLITPKKIRLKTLNLELQKQHPGFVFKKVKEIPKNTPIFSLKINNESTLNLAEENDIALLASFFAKSKSKDYASKETASSLTRFNQVSRSTATKHLTRGKQMAIKLTETLEAFPDYLKSKQILLLHDGASGTSAKNLKVDWVFPSDHLPVQSKKIILGGNNLTTATWNVLNQKFNDQRMADWKKLNNSSPEERLNNIQLKVETLTATNNIICLQEVSRDLLDSLNKSLPKNKTLFWTKNARHISSDFGVTIVDNNLVKDFSSKGKSSEISNSNIYGNDKYIQDISLTSNGEDFNVVNTHVAMNKLSELQTYLQRKTRKTLVHGDFNSPIADVQKSLNGKDLSKDPSQPTHIAGLKGVQRYDAVIEVQ